MRWNYVIFGVCAGMIIVVSPACDVDAIDDEQEIGAAVAEAGRRVVDARDGVAGEPAGELPRTDDVDAPDDEASAPAGKCCYVRCGAQLRYHKIPWMVEGSCDAEGWDFCADFYVTKLTDAAWLPC